MSTRENAVHGHISSSGLRRQEADMRNELSHEPLRSSTGIINDPSAGEIDVGGGNDRASQWARVKARMAVELGDATFNSWVKPVDMIGLGDGKVVLSAPTRFIRSWVASHLSLIHI